MSRVSIDGLRLDDTERMEDSKDIGRKVNGGGDPDKHIVGKPPCTTPKRQ